MELNRSGVRVSRLLNLLATLTEANRPLTAAEIRSRLSGYGDTDDAFLRNFNRDKSELRDLGIDVEVVTLTVNELPEYGYRVARSNYALRDPGLTPEETAALQLAVSMVRLDGADDGLWKLSGQSAEHLVAPQQAELPSDDRLAVGFTAVAERRKLQFVYSGKPRVVEPYRLRFARGRWYLLANEHLGRAKPEEERQFKVKNFRLDRAEQVKPLGAPAAFELPEDDVLAEVPDPWQLGSGDVVTARIAVDAAQAPLALASLGEKALRSEVTDDGESPVIFELEVTHPEGFRTFILDFLDHAEVLSPPQLRQDMVDWLEGVVALNKGGEDG